MAICVAEREQNYDALFIYINKNYGQKNLCTKYEEEEKLQTLNNTNIQ